MRKLFLLLLPALLGVACLDNDYDLTDIDTDHVAVGDDESVFRIPLARVSVSLDEIASGGVDVEALFREADVWLPSPLPGGETSVDMQRLQSDASYVEPLLDALTAQMLGDEGKLGDVADLLCTEKYIGTFLPLLPAGTTAAQFKAVFVDGFRNDAALRQSLGAEVRSTARRYLTTLHVETLEYPIGHIGIDSKVVDMLADNLDPEQTADPKNTLHLEGSVSNRLPLALRLDPQLRPAEISFSVEVEADNAENAIPATRLFAGDLRQIVEQLTVEIPVTLETYFPGKGFRGDQAHQLVIDLRLTKRGGLKLDL